MGESWSWADYEKQFGPRAKPAPAVVAEPIFTEPLGTYEAEAPPRASIRDRIVAALDADPVRIWTATDLEAELGFAGPCRQVVAALAALNGQGRIVRVKHGRYRSIKGPALQERVPAANPNPITRVVSRRNHIPEPEFVPPSEPMTPLQKEAFMRDLVARACVAVQVDLELAIGADDRLDRLHRWGEKLFSMGHRAALGLAVSKEHLAERAE